MRLCDNQTVIIGPPGTGKTTWLIDKVREIESEGIDLKEIAFISFTREAVKEARSRVSSERLDGFRTLHSMAYALCGLRPGDVFQNTQNYTVSACDEKHDYFALLYGLHRSSGKPLSETWKPHRGRPWTEVDFTEWCKTYTDSKELSGKMDFTDMIQRIIDHPPEVKFKVVFIDEAQDFNLMQWQALTILCRGADRVYIAGDSDQALYGFTGCDGSYFASLDGEKVVLDQSYRLPKPIHDISARVLAEKGAKPLSKPTDKPGKVCHIVYDDLFVLDYAKPPDTWFILARTNNLLAPIHSWLQDQGIPYGTLSGQTRQTRSEIAVRAYIHRQETGNTSNIPKLLSEACDGAVECQEALKAGKPWYEAFTTWEHEKRRYYLQRMDKKPLLHTGTFHGSKGSEADNVVVLGDYRGLRDEGTDFSGEVNAVYVAVTRARKNLILVQKRGIGYDWNTILTQKKEN